MAKKVQPHRGYYVKKVSMSIEEKQEIISIAKELGVTARDILEHAVSDDMILQDGTFKPVEIVKGTIYRI